MLVSLELKARPSGSPRQRLFPGNKNGGLLRTAGLLPRALLRSRDPVAAIAARSPDYWEAALSRFAKRGAKHLSGLLSLLAEDAMPSQKNHTDLMELSHTQA
jgi:hypothetical protein